MRAEHTIEPFYCESSRVLILGSLPSPKSREQGFYYAHPQNRFWRVLSRVLGEELPQSIDWKKDMCTRHGVALWDVIKSCDISGASDSSIRDAVPNELEVILEKAHIEAIFTTGKKAWQLYNKYCRDRYGINAVCLSSTSPANCAVSEDELVHEYMVIKETLDRTK